MVSSVDLNSRVNIYISSHSRSDPIFTAKLLLLCGRLSSLSNGYANIDSIESHFISDQLQLFFNYSDQLELEISQIEKDRVKDFDALTTDDLEGEMKKIDTFYSKLKDNLMQL